MTILWKQAFQLLKLINSETGLNQVCWGISLGFILGMSPVLSLQSLLVFLILLFFRVQFGAAMASTFFFKFAAYLLDGPFHKLGTVILTHDPLRPLFEKMYNMPLIPFTQFYNTIVMGSGVLSIILSPFIYLLSFYMLSKYRTHIYSRIQSSRTLKLLKASQFYQWYKKYEEFS